MKKNSFDKLWQKEQFFLPFFSFYVIIVANLGGVAMNGVSIEFSQQEKETTLVRKKSKFLYRFIKRLFDILISGLSLIMLSPIFLLIAILIKIDSKGSIIFKQKRIGKDGQPIYIYKFRMDN